MSANFWKGSQCASWLYETEKAVQLERQKDNDFLSEDQSTCVQIFYCDVMIALGKNLGLRQQVVATAIMYFKRFYLKNSWTCVKPYLMALTCVYLAAKVEESGPIQGGQFCAAGKQIAAQAEFKEYTPDRFEIPDVIGCEFYLVQAMQCCLIVFHPYRSLVEYANDANISTTALPLAWNIVNDSLKNDICFHKPPYLIALAALQIASSVLEETKFAPWLATLNVSISEVMETVQVLMNMFATLRGYKPGALLKSALTAIQEKAADLDAQCDS
eukprot:m.186066 g.186066  ORF g.186066 m.186066 type:complete len:272 (+) comp32252_c0_seq7:238-1053(+)